MPVNGHTPGLSVLGSDKKRAEHRELRLSEDDRFRGSRISTFDGRKLNDYAVANRCRNSQEPLIGAGVFSGGNRRQALVFLRLAAARFICATTLMARFTYRRAYDGADRRWQTHSVRKKRCQNDTC